MVGMNSNIKILITVVIGVVLVTSVTVVAYEYMKDPGTQDSMYSFLPYNSSAVVWVNYNGTNVVYFGSSNSSGILLNSINLNNTSITTSGKNSTFSSLLTITNYSSYGGYEIMAINASKETEKLANFTTNLTEMGGFASSLKNLTLYAYNPYGSSIILGSYQEVKNSINAHNKGNNFLPLSKYIDQNNNISFYFRPVNSSYVQYAWGGMNKTSAYAYIELTNSSSLNFNLSLNMSGLRIVTLSSHEIEIIVPLSELSQLQSMFSKTYAELQ
jgi:hypothetical protein